MRPFFFFNDTATTEIYTLSLHDALPIWLSWTENIWIGTSIEDIDVASRADYLRQIPAVVRFISAEPLLGRSEEHTSELQSRLHLVCRLLLEKKKAARGTSLTPPVPCTSS